MKVRILQQFHQIRNDIYVEFSDINRRLEGVIGPREPDQCCQQQETGATPASWEARTRSGKERAFILRMTEER